MPKNPSDVTALKFIMVGDPSTGKTTLSKNWADQTSNRNTHNPTTGVDFSQRTLDINGTELSMKLWDTAGAETYTALVRSYFRGNAGAFLVYDITNRKTFENADKWIQDIKDSNTEEPNFILIGNKKDLVQRRQVTLQEAKIYAEKHGLIFAETCAFDLDSINEAFEKFAKHVFEKYNRGEGMQDARGIELRKRNSVQSQEGEGLEKEKKGCSC